jgi:hypothetical protein
MNNVSTDDCWLYAGIRDKTGYGRLSYMQLAHRVMYTEVVGEIPKGLEIDHLCKVPACINPEHLEPVTHAINMQRIYGVNRCKRGHELTKDNVYVGVKNKLTGRVGRQCKRCSSLRHKASYKQLVKGGNRE